MTNSQRLATVRRCLTRWLRQHGGNGDTLPIGVPFRESILIRDGFYCGRRFHAPGHEAVWFLEEDQLKIASDDGQTLEVFSGDQISRFADEPAPEIRRAA